MMTKKLLVSGIGALGAIVTTMFGGWSAGLTTLMILMGSDYVSGLIVAGVFHKSKKTENGRLESKAGWKGLCRKFITLLMVAVAYRIDLMVKTNYLMDAVMLAFCANETISIIENAGLMGIPIPKQFKDAIEVLKKKNS